MSRASACTRATSGRLVRVMKNLRDKGNTLLVVEHEESVIRAADNLIELGPGRGEAGGGPRFQRAGRGRCENVAAIAHRRLPRRTQVHPGPRRNAARRSTGSRSKAPPSTTCARSMSDFPLGAFHLRHRRLRLGQEHAGQRCSLRELPGRSAVSAPDESCVGRCAKLIGTQHVESIVLVDQSPLSRTPRSSPAVYLGVFDPIRELFAHAARSRGGRASPPARSPSIPARDAATDARGNGFEKIEMQFLSDVFVRCPECDGKRYQPHVLKIKINGKSIHDVLD